MRSWAKVVRILVIGVPLYGYMETISNKALIRLRCHHLLHVTTTCMVIFRRSRRRDKSLSLIEATTRLINYDPSFLYSIPLKGYLVGRRGFKMKHESYQDDLRKELFNCFPNDERENYEAMKEELLSMLHASLIRKELSRSKKRSYETPKKTQLPISPSYTANECSSYPLISAKQNSTMNIRLI